MSDREWPATDRRFPVPRVLFPASCLVRPRPRPRPRPAPGPEGDWTNC